MTRNSVHAVNHSNPALAPGHVVDARYRLEKLLGRGGMAVVYTAHDTTRNRSVALKRLLPVDDPSRRERTVELFEREFRMLAELAHPCIVQVYDFGIDEAGAYYTMELLTGRELQDVSPLPWRNACALARDVCSALSLVHSRRFVHRDVSPRNVHCLEDGSAKLIDFGVVAPMGATKVVVGTPPCCAPESMLLQALDARTDLFALGATLYFALVGRHAFSVRRLNDLAEAWQMGFSRPSELVPGIPAALDALVLDLLRLDPDARPVSAAEVIERLTAIDGVAARDESRTAASYLATPSLVGRDAEIARVQRRFPSASSERTSSVLIEGPAGAGRTRLLDACLLNATLRGVTVVRCDADDAIQGDYGVARALARKLAEAMPALVQEAAAPLREHLSSLLPPAATKPSASAPAPAPANDVTAVPRSHLQQALRQWLRTLAARQAFIIAIDDVHRIDEPSASLLALLETDAQTSGLCLLLTAEASTDWSAESAHKLLTGMPRIELNNLAPTDVEKLLRSLFGDVPHLALLTHHVVALSGGNPRDILRLAQHFIDRGVISYKAGAWSLPNAFDEADLPASMAQALSARLADLDATARRVAWALARSPDRSFSLDDCAQLTGESDRVRLSGLCERLITLEIARSSDERLVLSHASWGAVLRSDTPKDHEIELERALGELFERDRAQAIRSAEHWFRAGEPARALDILVEHAERSQVETARSTEVFAAYLRGLPQGWFATFEQALEQCERLQRPRRDRFALLSRLSGITVMLNMFSAHDRALFAMLEQDSGLRDWAQLAALTDPKERLTQALARAQARYDAAPDSERVSDVRFAIQFLVRLAATSTAAVATSLDVAYLRSLPRLTPLAALSPGIAVACKLIEGIDARCSGRVPLAHRLYLETIERVQKPDRAGVDESHAGYIALGLMSGLGIMEAAAGMDSCLTWAERIAGHPSYTVNAVLIRLLYHAFQGDARAADEARRHAERLRIQDLGRAVYEGQQLIGEAQAYALAGDLTRLRHTCDEIAPLAKRLPAWVPILSYAKAEYRRLLGDHHSALQHAERSLALASAGSHQIWPVAASVHVQILIDLDLVGAAADQADQYIEMAERELQYVPERLRLVQAVAHARTGRADAADLADAVISHMQTMGFGKLMRGVAHESRARIALALDDRDAFELHEGLCRELFSTQGNAALVAKCHRLAQESEGAVHRGRETTSPEPLDSQFSATRIDLALADCDPPEHRMQLALTILANHSHVDAGCLFCLDDAGPYLAAQFGEVDAPLLWLARVTEYLEHQRDALDPATVMADQETELPTTTWYDGSGAEYHPIVLQHTEDGDNLITGVAVLAAKRGVHFQAPVTAAAAISRFFAGLGSRSLSCEFS